MFPGGDRPCVGFSARPLAAVPLLALLLGAALASVAWIEAGPLLCPFHWATGLPCPGCGLTRSVVALAHGDLAGALFFHPLGPLVAAGLVAAAMSSVVVHTAAPCGVSRAVGRARARLADRRLRAALTWLAAGLVVALWAIRLPLFVSGRWVY